MLLISRTNWLNVLQASDLIGSKRLERSIAVFLKNDFGLLLEREEQEEEEEEEGEEVQGEEEGEEEEGGGKKEERSKNDNDDDKNKNNSNNNKSSKNSKNNKSSITISMLHIVRSNFPVFLENLLTERRSEFPLPPSQIFIKYTKKQAIEKKETQDVSGKRLPLWAIVVAGGSALIFQNIQQITSIGWLIPVVNGVLFVIVLLYTMGFFNRVEKEVSFL